MFGISRYCFLTYLPRESRGHRFLGWTKVNHRCRLAHWACCWGSSWISSGSWSHIYYPYGIV